MSSKVAQQEPDLLELRKELTAGTINSRMKLLVLSQTAEKRRFPTLEDRTKVAENTWRTWWTKGAMPSGALVAGAGRAWPEYAFWLVTGLTDVEYGHCMPPLHIAAEGYVNNYPEANITSRSVYAAEYFNTCRELQDANNDGESKRYQILENTRRFLKEKRSEEICKYINKSIEHKT